MSTYILEYAPQVGPTGMWALCRTEQPDLADATLVGHILLDPDDTGSALHWAGHALLRQGVYTTGWDCIHHARHPVYRAVTTTPTWRITKYRGRSERLYHERPGGGWTSYDGQRFGCLDDVITADGQLTPVAVDDLAALVADLHMARAAVHAPTVATLRLTPPVDPVAGGELLAAGYAAAHLQRVPR